jgi:hypothetical protein
VIAMTIIFIAFIAGVLGGTFAGGLITWRIVRRFSPLYLDRRPQNHDLDHEMSRAASRWAAANGRPEAAGLVADKLRLVYHLNQQRAARLHRRRWFR